MNEGQIRFIIRARAGTLWTAERLNFIFNEKNNSFSRGCKCIETLSRILNAFANCFSEMTVRHNDVCKMLSQYLKKFKKQLIILETGKKNELKFKLRWNSRIRLPYILKKKDFDEEEDTPDAARKRSDL
jgi:hypothetical protein